MKQNQTDADNISPYGLDRGTHQLFWALVFQLGIDWAFWGDDPLPRSGARASTSGENPWAHLDLVADVHGGAGGVLSCETNISEIVSDSISIISLLQ